MAQERDWSALDEVVTPARVVGADSLCRSLLSVAARAVHGRDCADRGHLPLVGRYRGMPPAARRAAVTRAGVLAALPAHRIGQVDAEAVARWFTGRYPARRYPAVLLGSPHGGAVHLAARLGAAWLPTAFPISVQWPGGAVDDPADALAHGARLVPDLVRANPSLAVRQVHDPVGRGVLAGSTVELVARWCGLPEAYRRFLASRLAAGSPVLLVQDTRTWPVLDAGDRHTFQVGSPAGGLEPAELAAATGALGTVLHAAGGDPRRWRLPGEQADAPAEYAVDGDLGDHLRRWAGSAGIAVHGVRYHGPHTLSAAVADVLRRRVGLGQACLVDCGRLLDPVATARAGLVPYWCESATRAAVAGAEWWLAGSARFDEVDAVPEPAGVPGADQAALTQWRAVVSFGRLRGTVERTAARAYPTQPLPTRHVSAVLRERGCQAGRLPALTVTDALAGLRRSGSGLLVC